MDSPVNLIISCIYLTGSLKSEWFTTLNYYIQLFGINRKTIFTEKLSLSCNQTFSSTVVV